MLNLGPFVALNTVVLERSCVFRAATVLRPFAVLDFECFQFCTPLSMCRLTSNSQWQGNAWPQARLFPTFTQTTRLHHVAFLFRKLSWSTWNIFGRTEGLFAACLVYVVGTFSPRCFQNALELSFDAHSMSVGLILELAKGTHFIRFLRCMQIVLQLNRCFVCLATRLASYNKSPENSWSEILSKIVQLAGWKVLVSRNVSYQLGVSPQYTWPPTPSWVLWKCIWGLHALHVFGEKLLAAAARYVEKGSPLISFRDARTCKFWAWFHTHRQFALIVPVPWPTPQCCCRAWFWMHVRCCFCSYFGASYSPVFVHGKKCCRVANTSHAVEPS